MSASPSTTPTAAAPGALSAALRQAGRFDTRSVSWPAGLLAAIPVVAVLGIPIAAGDPVAGVTMGAGAMLVGIAWRTAGGRPPLGVMAADALMMALATFAGCVTGGVLWVHLVTLAGLSLVGGLLVGIGNRGGVIGTQAIIAAIVFGRFAEPAGQAAGLAGLVLSGGAAQVAMQTLIRWPSPLRAQRRLTAAGYRALSELAVATAPTIGLEASQALDAAQDSLGAATLFGDPSLRPLRDLAEEGHRLRVALVAVRALARRRDCADAARAALRHACVTLRLTADALDGEPGATAALDAEVQALSREVAGPRARGATGSGDPSAAILQRRLAGLAGQLRAVAALAGPAARGGGWRGRRPQRQTSRPLRRLWADLQGLNGDLSWESPVGRHALRLALVVPAAELISRALPLSRGYWMVVAAATVLRPEFGATFTRGAERALGTCAGVALAGAIAAGLHPAGAATVALVGGFAWLAYATFPASFAAGFGFVTALVVFLLNALSPDTLATASARLLDTLVGGVLGLAVFALWPTWSDATARDSLAELLAAQRAYLDEVLGRYARGTRPGIELRPFSRRARVARMSAQSAVARSLSEPPARRIDVRLAQGTLGALLRMEQATHVLRLEAEDESRPLAPQPALARLAASLDGLLGPVGRALRSGVALPSYSLPDLRAAHQAFAEHAGGAPADLVTELDEVVDAANGLAELVAARPGRSPPRD